MFSVKYLSCCENYAIFAKHKQKSMNKTYFKYKYVLIFILSLIVFMILSVSRRKSIASGGTRQAWIKILQAALSPNFDCHT